MGKVGGRGPKSRSPCKVAEAGVSLPLAGVVVEVRDQTETQRVSAVQAFNDAQVAGCLSEALPETQATVVHCQGMGIKITFASSSVKHLQMVNSHLQNFCFL